MTNYMSGQVQDKKLNTYYFFFFKQKTAYEMRISDWSSEVCSSDLIGKVDYLGKRPSPVYPRASERRGEQGRVVVRVLISAQGTEIGRASCRERVCQYV